MFLASMLFALFYCLSPSVVNLQCFLMGVCQTGSYLWSAPWTVSTRVAGGLCTLVRGLLSARVVVVSVAALPAALDRDLSQCGWPLTVASSSPQVSLPGHVSVVAASVCGCECVSAYVWECVYECVCICVGLCACLRGWESLLIFFSLFSWLFSISVVVFNLFVLLSV